ncbi:hypothetical protein EDD76_10937 [Kineothrix alysoides]|uniref:Uncharacterized protein n=1 Tax=Kineothrix alysoides TaxID=1469948 RepID=A0A4R1QWJ5_9FIRM|nr:hypothetical protein EDD76_10937 [Kineothrix alysoides]
MRVEMLPEECKDNRRWTSLKNSVNERGYKKGNLKAGCPFLYYYFPVPVDMVDIHQQILMTDFTIFALSATLASIAFWISSKSKTLVTIPFKLILPPATASIAIG